MSNFDSSIAHIVYASDDSFAEILGVSLTSLYENSRDMDELVVYILDSGISDKNKKKILSVGEYYYRSAPVFIPAQNISEKLSMNVSLDRGSLSQYARLFISSDLPDELSRVIYLDCDIIINKSVKELWNIDLNGKTVGALMDAFSKHYRRNIDLNENDVMFNSGVMVIDLTRWKKSCVEDRLIEFIISKKGVIQQGDQGALNAVLSQNVFCFEPRFNSVTIFYDFSYEEIFVYRRPPEFYSEAQIAEAVERPSLIHYTTSFASRRPWVAGSNHRYAGEWDKYKKISPWNDNALWDDGRKQWKMKVYDMLPRALSVRVAGFLQIYCRPFIYTLKSR